MPSPTYYTVLKDNRMKRFFECGLAKEINNQLVLETQQINH